MKNDFIPHTNESCHFPRTCPLYHRILFWMLRTFGSLSSAVELLYFIYLKSTDIEGNDYSVVL